MSRLSVFLLLGALLAGGAWPAQAPQQIVIVSAPQHSFREAPVSVILASVSPGNRVMVRNGAERVPAQVHWEGGRAEVTWLVRDLKQGETRRYGLFIEKGASTGPVDRPGGVSMERSGENVEFTIAGKLATRYDTTTGPNKPYFYPLMGPGGQLMVRHLPPDMTPSETRDHPHHRGLWFTHSSFNGQDFWNVEKRGPAPRTVHRRYEWVEAGPVWGGLRADTDWIGTDGKKVCEDVREARIYPTAEGRLIDFTITIRATEGPLVFGDAKDGALGLRVADTMRVQGGGGHIETGAGKKDVAAWSTHADWADYYGPVDGATLGVAIFDHPGNLRHPTGWHARDYGLFAANPFAVHDFDPQQPRHAGDYTVPAGGTLTLRYRLYLHNGATAEAHVADAWAAYADPPKVDLP